MPTFLANRRELKRIRQFAWKMPGAQQRAKPPPDKSLLGGGRFPRDDLNQKMTPAITPRMVAFSMAPVPLG